jgi:hypothetical protein
LVKQVVLGKGDGYDEEEETIAGGGRKNGR